MISRERILSRLQIGFFAPRDNDGAVADRLIAGRRKFGEAVLDVRVPRSFDAPGSLPRNNLLELHSLRWADVLRRADSVPGAQQAWEGIVNAWAASEAAADRNSVAWGITPLEQRCVALALGTGDLSGTPGILDRHVTAVVSHAVEAVSSLRRLRLLDVQLGLLVRRGDPDEALRAAAIAAAESAFHESGYTVAEDLTGVAGATEQWIGRLESLEVPSDDAVFDRLRSELFWLHVTAPDGELVPIGSGVPRSVPGAENPRMRYILTGGEEGSPPTQVRSVDPEGLVSLRSGWGETERDAREETLVTMLLGPVRGREAHGDVARVTYHSQGRPWLIDPALAVETGPEGHSVISVDDVRYRIHGDAELVRQYGDDRVDGFMVKCSVHQAFQWQRHVVFARTGNYLVVDDTTRASTEYVAAQRWIVAPDVEIEPTLQGFRLHADGKTVALNVSTLGLKDHSIDDLHDDAGNVVAQRISVPMVGSSNRAVAVIADVVDPRVFRARRVPRTGKEFTVDIKDKQLDETLVVTPELSAIVPAGLDPDEAVERTIALGAAGDLSEEEQLAQRRAVRDVISQVKSQILRDGGGVDARTQGLDQLLAAGDELKVRGLRDHGYGAALVDVAGTDLADRIAGNPQVGNLRRTALVDWPGQDLVQPAYGVRVRTTTDSTTVPDGLEERSVWSVDLGQLVPSAFLTDGPGDILTVYFHGATDRSRLSMPRYERMRSFAGLGLGPMMFFSDPCLDLDSRMMLSWYVGTEEVDVHREIACMIEAYARSKGIEKVLLVGNSGGGFAALQQGAYLEGTRVVSFNPQIRIDDYVPRIAQTAHWALFGRETVSDDPVNAPRMDLIERYRRIGFDQDVVLIQNPGDDHHHQEHFLPFVKAFESSDKASRLVTHTPYLGPGHRVPPSDEYLDFVRDAAAAHTESTWSLRGRRDMP